MDIIDNLTMEQVIILVLFGVVILAVQIAKYLHPEGEAQHPLFDWPTFMEKIDEDEKWHRCHEGPGCDWPEHCKPGNCRRPE